MTDLSPLPAFLVAALVVLLIPGPAVFYIVGRSVDQGRRAGVVSALGVGVGNGVQALAAAAGLSAVLASSAVAFTALRYVGAAYLIYLGLRRLLHRDDGAVATAREPELSRTFYQGVVVAVLNPKTAVFFLAFLPQFVTATEGSGGQILLLGLIFVAMGTCTDSTYALLSGTITSVVKRGRRMQRGAHYVAAGVYLTLGVTAAASGPRSR